MTEMTKRERVLAAVQKAPVDMLPYTFWTHLPGIDLDPVRLAETTFSFFKEYDIDIVKTMNNGMYSVEDFGCTVDYSGIARGGVATVSKTPISSGKDWLRIAPAPLTAPALSRELRSLGLLLDMLRGKNVPVVFTVFSPLTTALKLGCGRLISDVEAGCGEQVKSALEAITQTTCALVKEVISMGADGVYFASQLSDHERCSEEFYKEYGVPFDLRVLNASLGGCDVLHAHGNSIMFDILKDYPVDIFNWHVFESAPELAKGSRQSGKCIMGGLCRGDVTSGNREGIDARITDCLNALHGRGHILSPGCVIRYPLDRDTLLYIRQAKLRLERQAFSRPA